MTEIIPKTGAECRIDHFKCNIIIWKYLLVLRRFLITLFDYLVGFDVFITLLTTIFITVA